MNKKKTRALRKKIYGDLSFREAKHGKVSTGQIFCTGKREEYRKAKKGG